MSDQVLRVLQREDEQEGGNNTKSDKNSFDDLLDEKSWFQPFPEIHNIRLALPGLPPTL
jgi:hypothetical protein